MKSIDVFIAGAQKAGTTSLKAYLGTHPWICTHKEIEFAYFSLADLYELGYENAAAGSFRHCPGDDYKLLAKNIAVMYDPNAIDRLFDHNPEILLIVVLRNPVDRAYSAYWYARQMGMEDVSSFDRAVWLSPERHQDPVAMRTCSYLERGAYVEHLAHVLATFSRERVMIISSSDLKDDPASVCLRVFRGLGLDPIAPKIDQLHNTAAVSRSPHIARIFLQPSRLRLAKSIFRKSVPARIRRDVRRFVIWLNRNEKHIPAMNEDTRTKLVDYYRPYNQELGKLLNQDFSEWNV